MLKTDRFRKREGELAKALSSSKLQSLWKKRVRETLRNDTIFDLHDHYDFHLNLKNRVSALIDSVALGLYQPNRPIRFRSEKRLGVSRHLVVVSPEDALILEAIGEHLTPVIKNAQPSKNAYYSRNQPQPKTPLDVDENFGYPWWILWPQFQKRILEFSEHHDFTVVTDVATYYDTIDFTQLRNFIASLNHFSEIFLDFVFFILEKLVWRPDYLPHPGKGLPQINLDTPRLLAHAFLFEADEFLKQRSGDDFVRWLDDIDFGCDSVQEAKTLLRNLDELLLSRGLHLNSSKTKILTKKEAFEHFQLRENRYLNIFQKRLKRKKLSCGNLKPESKRLRKRYLDYDKEGQKGQWGKIAKRYFTLFGILNDPYLDSECKTLLYEHPELRPSIFRYFKSIGWSEEREGLLTDYISTKVMDDESFFAAIDVLLSWAPAPAIKYVQRMRKLANSLEHSRPMKFLGALWLIAKFGNKQNIDNLILTNTNTWKNNQWLSRQVACLWPRMELQKTRHAVKNIIHSFGLTDAKKVLDNYEFMVASNTLFKNNVRPYVLATKKGGEYPLPKLLILISVLKSEIDPKIKTQIKAHVLSTVNCTTSKGIIKSCP